VLSAPSNMLMPVVLPAAQSPGTGPLRPLAHVDISLQLTLQHNSPAKQLRANAGPLQIAHWGMPIDGKTLASAHCSAAQVSPAFPLTAGARTAGGGDAPGAPHGAGLLRRADHRRAADQGHLLGERGRRPGAPVQSLL
jgi:hypothetical protein